MATIRKNTEYLFRSLISFVFIFILLTDSTAAAPIGVCYGRIANNLPPPAAAVDLLKSNGITRVRLFNANPEALRPFSGTGIELMIGVPNEILPSLASGPVNLAREWLTSSIFAHVAPFQVRYLAVGNEIFLQDPFYTPYVVPAITNLHNALQILGLDQSIQLSSALAASALSNSYPPSSGTFDPDLRSTMIPLLTFLSFTGSPLMVNIYPFFSHVNNPQHVSLDYALFRTSDVVHDHGLTYDNLFDSTIDAFVSAMEKEGFMGIPVMVTETGWPTAGDEAANAENALAYNGNVVRRALNNVGTPKRPGVGVKVFLFDLFDENEKGGEEYEKHFGIFGSNGHKAYDLGFN